MQTAVITPRPPGSHRDAFAQHAREGVSAASAAAAQALRVQMLWALAGQGRRHDSSAAADAVGSP